MTCTPHRNSSPTSANTTTITQNKNQKNKNSPWISLSETIFHLFLLSNKFRALADLSLIDKFSFGYIVSLWAGLEISSSILWHFIVKWFVVRFNALKAKTVLFRSLGSLWTKRRQTPNFSICSHRPTKIFPILPPFGGDHLSVGRKHLQSVSTQELKSFSQAKPISSSFILTFFQEAILSPSFLPSCQQEEPKQSSFLEKK